MSIVRVVVIWKGQENNVIIYFLQAYDCFDWHSQI